MNKVYFARVVGSESPIKIGRSRAPKYRLRAVGRDVGGKMELLAEIAGHFNLERRFHLQFLANREWGEWFTNSPEVVATIAAINAGTFDTDTLPAPAVIRREQRATA